MTAVAREADVSPSTCFNILRTLVRARFAAFDERDKTYRLGLGVAELALGFLGVAQADLIRPELKRLALNYETLLALWQVTDDRHLLLLDRACADTAVRVEMRPGLRLPMLAGAVGRAAAGILDLPEAELRRRFAALRWDSSPGSGTTPTRWRRGISVAGRQIAAGSTAASSPSPPSRPTATGDLASGSPPSASSGSTTMRRWRGSGASCGTWPTWSSGRCRTGAARVDRGRAPRHPPRRRFRRRFSGISLGHPIGATGVRMTATLPRPAQQPLRARDHVHRRRAGGSPP